ncbi:SAM-dependent methyltransferase [Meridianimaribacter sp. CL38]|uniref:tRNA (5-methylaminomethyl-2-thiouridine)(34)-methyltransferase MnmD n=1 Tax=Meridianimaribacter sp. CL38 TaxID=2213021 RepID=UPI00103C3982|nr:tRNA (5-methylaminomethyl-2-thiouridine)(34)-methyltransferase MnmD [Meridianimaribacter sp. CL38]TBV26177.1 SAM-dependent methyltransferase [Meridianimaribacter sp. CL38]
MKRKIITTADGSKTIQIEDWNEQYHSVHGAIQEAMHVFILHGLFCFLDSHKPISILEIGFGTGLNAFITLLESEKSNLHINYTGVEAYPVTQEEVDALNYTEQLKTNNTLFSKLHQCDWEILHHITPKFSLTKQQKFFKEIDAVAEYDLIYFDAFGARVQPELWTEVIFELMYKALKPKGVLVTYSAKGSVRRAMQAVGFSVEKLPGPPGKREMLRATKLEV